MDIFNNSENKEKEQNIDFINERNHCCFFLKTTDFVDKEEDEKADFNDYNEYKKRHPLEGAAIWINYIKGEKYIYLDGNETIYQLDPNGADDAIKVEIFLILKNMHTDEAKRKGCSKIFDYDYAWIKLAIDRNLFNGCGRLIFSMPSFRSFIQSMGYTDICKEETLNKYYSAANGKYPNFYFKDTKGRTNSERNRRNTFIRYFVEKMREIRGEP